MVQAASQLLFYTELTCPLLTYYVAVWFIPHVGINFMQEVREVLQRSPGGLMQVCLWLQVISSYTTMAYPSLNVSCV